MWKVPPLGRERSKARTTFCVSCSTVSRTLLETHTAGAMHGQEGLHQGDGDLARLEGDDGAIAANDLVGLVNGRQDDLARGRRAGAAPVRSGEKGAEEAAALVATAS